MVRTENALTSCEPYQKEQFGRLKYNFAVSYQSKPILAHDLATPLPGPYPEDTKRVPMKDRGAARVMIS